MLLYFQVLVYPQHVDAVFVVPEGLALMLLIFPHLCACSTPPDSLQEARRRSDAPLGAHGLKAKIPSPRLRFNVIQPSKQSVRTRIPSNVDTK